MNKIKFKILIKNPSFFHLVFSIILILIGLFFAIESTKLPPGFMQALPADVYPRFLSITIILLAFIKAIKNGLKLKKQLKKQENQEENDIKNKINNEFTQKYFNVIVMIILFFAYVVLVPYVGYYETGWFFLILTIFFLGNKSLNWLMKAFIISSLVLLVVYLTFSVFLNIYVPGGILLQ